MCIRDRCRADPSTVKYLGLALTPQAGVSIGLAVLGQRMLPAAEGTMLATIILSSAVLYELTLSLIHIYWYYKRIAECLTELKNHCAYAEYAGLVEKTFKE